MGAGEQTLRTRCRAFDHTLDRTSLRFYFVFWAIFSGALLLALLVLWLQGRTVINDRMLPWSTSPPSVNRLQVLQLGGIIAEFNNTVFIDLLLSVNLPISLSLAAVLLGAVAVGRVVRRLLYRNPGVIEQLLERNEIFLPSHSRFIMFVLSSASVVAVAGSAALAYFAMLSYFPHFLGLIFLGMLTSDLVRQYKIRKRQPLSRRVSRDYVRLVCVRKLVTHICLCASAFLGFTVCQGCLRHYTSVIFPRSVNRVLAELDGAMSQSRRLQRRTDLFQQARSKTVAWSTTLRNHDLWAVVDEIGRPDLATLFIVVFALGAYVDIFGSLLLAQANRTGRLLLLTAMLVVALEWLSGAFQEMLQASGLWNYISSFGIIFLVFVVGQVSGFVFALFGHNELPCPRCSYETLSTQSSCGVCGSRVDLLRGGELVKNIESHELHWDRCHHVKRTDPLKLERVQSVEQEYLDGFDNCGSCLGGSGWRWNELRI